ncbi:MAG: response regulator, partial [Lachnospiraceae bacterium]|nr:response regulator [Lachnospiraceae bacterium]
MKVQTKRIYIADDDDNIRQALRIFLENEGYCVEAFETGDLLFQRFQEDACDLIILDIMLPGTSGFDICRKIR